MYFAEEDKAAVQPHSAFLDGIAKWGSTDWIKTGDEARRIVSSHPEPESMFRGILWYMANWHSLDYGMDLIQVLGGTNPAAAFPLKYAMNFNLADATDRISEAVWYILSGAVARQVNLNADVRLVAISRGLMCESWSHRDSSLWALDALGTEAAHLVVCHFADHVFDKGGNLWVTAKEILENWHESRE